MSVERRIGKGYVEMSIGDKWLKNTFVGCISFVPSLVRLLRCSPRQSPVVAVVRSDTRDERRNTHRLHGQRAHKSKGDCDKK